jgi:hypothetical protein
MNNDILYCTNITLLTNGLFAFRVCFIGAVKTTVIEFEFQNITRILRCGVRWSSFKENLFMLCYVCYSPYLDSAASSFIMIDALWRKKNLARPPGCVLERQAPLWAMGPERSRRNQHTAIAPARCSRYERIITRSDLCLCGCSPLTFRPLWRGIDNIGHVSPIG